MMTLLDKPRLIRLHIQGKSNREIGRIMHVSRNTVGKYMRECEGPQSELVACASDVRFAPLCENRKKDVLLDSQARLFEFTGGTFREGACDNMKNVVAGFMGRGEKEPDPEPLRISACCGFAPDVCNCFSGREKGAVEPAAKVVRNRAFALEWRFDTPAGAQARLDAVLAKLDEDRDVGAERRAPAAATAPRGRGGARGTPRGQVLVRRARRRAPLGAGGAGGEEGDAEDISQRGAR